MKYSLSVIIMIILLTACHRSPHRLPSGWQATGNAEADTLTERLDRDYGHNAGSGAYQWIAPLESIARANPENVRIGTRSAYWRVRMNLRIGDKRQARRILDSAMAAIDSAAYADDYHHLKMLRWRFDDSLLHRYIDATEMLAYFRHAGDSASVAFTLMNLGDIMQRVGDYSRGREYTSEASRIWRGIHQEEYADKNLLNVALMSDRHTSDSIHRRLLCVDKYKRDTAFYEIVLRNYFLDTDSVDYLLKAMALSENRSGKMNGIRPVHLALYSDYLSRNHLDAREALDYALKADAMRTRGEDRQFDMLASHALAMAYNTLHAADSANKYLLEYVSLKDTLSNAAMAVEVANKTSRDEIARADMTRNLKAEREKMMVWILLLVLALIFILVCFTLYHRVRDREMKAMKARAELDDARSRLSRESIIMKEKEDLLKLIQKEIETDNAEEILGSATTTRLRTAIKVHNSGDDERRTFLEIHDNMLPGFLARLQEVCPDLSEKQLRLAAYICAGMSSSAIGRVMNITPGSVNKSRYRLRTKLGLSSGDSLEAYLRSLTRQP